MIKNNSSNILLLDNDVLVYLFDLLYESQKQAVDKTLTFLALQYSRIWIPQTVKREFLRGQNDKKRQKRFDKILKNHTYITNCPIPISKTEIVALIGLEDENAGEADAILQAQKAKSLQTIFFNDIVLLSNDKGAQQRAKNVGINILKYKDLKAQLAETGITLF